MEQAAGRKDLSCLALPRMQIGEINIAQAADWHKQLRLACQLDQVQVMLRRTFHSAVSVVVSPRSLCLLLCHAPLTSAAAFWTAQVPGTELQSGQRAA